MSAPSLHPPQIKIGTHAPASELAPGYIFTTNFFDLNEPPIIGQSGPLILDRQLQPVWFQPVPEQVVAANLSPQSYHGKPVLSWWQGKVTNTGATESGEDVVVNQHYQPVAHLRATNGWVLTVHEFLIDGDHAWVTVNKNVPKDLSKYGGAYNGAMIDSAVQEYDLKTGKLLFNWDALKHIPLGESIASLPTNGFPWDAYHVNSIQLVGPETFLVSMRNTWAAYLVNARTGAIEWTLGGRRSDFSFGRGAAFQWQHDVRLRNSSTVTMFDDHCCQLTGGGSQVDATAPSRGLVLKLDQGARKATLLAQLRGRAEGGIGLHGRHPAAVQRQRVRGLGQPAVLLRVQPLREAAVRRRIPRARPHLPGHGRAVGRAAADQARGRGRAQRRRRRPCTRAGTAPPRRRPGGCWEQRAPAGR